LYWPVLLRAISHEPPCCTFVCLFVCLCLCLCLFLCSHTIGPMSPTRDVVLAFDTINHRTSSCQDLHPVEHCASRRRSPRPTSLPSGGATRGETQGHRPPAAWTTLTSVESLPLHTLVRRTPPPLLSHKRAMQQPGFPPHHSKACIHARMCNFIDHSLVLRTLRSTLFVDIDRRANGASQRPHRSR
jgi:hypothetical protein